MFLHLQYYKDRKAGKNFISFLTRLSVSCLENFLKQNSYKLSIKKNWQNTKCIFGQLFRQHEI